MLCGLTGDNDPVDVVEIGERQLETGGMYAVKPLAVLAMIDDGELDWKVRRLAQHSRCTHVHPPPHTPCAAYHLLTRMPCPWLLPATCARRLVTSLWLCR